MLVSRNAWYIYSDMEEIKELVNLIIGQINRFISIWVNKVKHLQFALHLRKGILLKFYMNVFIQIPTISTVISTCFIFPRLKNCNGWSKETTFGV